MIPGGMDVPPRYISVHLRADVPKRTGERGDWGSGTWRLTSCWKEGGSGSSKSVNRSVLVVSFSMSLRKASSSLSSSPSGSNAIFKRKFYRLISHGMSIR